MRSLWIVLVLVLGSALLLQVMAASDDRIPYARFRSLAESGELAEVEIRDDVYIGRAVPGLSARALQSYRTGRIEPTEKDLLADLDQALAAVRQIRHADLLHTLQAEKLHQLARFAVHCLER